LFLTVPRMPKGKYPRKSIWYLANWSPDSCTWVDPELGIQLNPKRGPWVWKSYFSHNSPPKNSNALRNYQIDRRTTDSNSSIDRFLPRKNLHDSTSPNSWWKSHFLTLDVLILEITRKACKQSSATMLEKDFFFRRKEVAALESTIKQKLESNMQSHLPNEPMRLKLPLRAIANRSWRWSNSFPSMTWGFYSRAVVMVGSQAIFWIQTDGLLASATGIERLLPD